MNKGFIFDMDGVLFDTEKLYERFWIEAASLYGYNMTAEDVASVRSTDSGMARKILKSRLGDSFDYDFIKKERIRLMSQFTNENGVELMDGVIELLDYVKQNNYRIALATTSNLNRAEDFLNKGKIRNYFDYLMTGDKVIKCKPDPEIYIKAAKGLLLNCEECFAVEDSYNGVRSAYSAGCKVIMVPHMDIPTDEMSKKTTVILNNIREIIGFIK